MGRLPVTKAIRIQLLIANLSPFVSARRVLQKRIQPQASWSAELLAIEKRSKVSWPSSANEFRPFSPRSLQCRSSARAVTSASRWEKAQKCDWARVILRMRECFKALPPSAKSGFWFRWKQVRFGTRAKTCPSTCTRNINFRKSASQPPTILSQSFRASEHLNLSKLPEARWRKKSIESK